jgi:hypothetical protein
MHDQSGCTEQIKRAVKWEEHGIEIDWSMWHVPASGTLAPECRTSLKSTALNAVNNPRYSLEPF